MLNFCSLYSGSSGNSLFVQTDNTKILVDAGESAKKIETALNSIDVDINEIDAVLVTHEHTDHIKGLATISKKFNIPIYANKETWEAMPQVAEKTQNQNLFNVNENFEIGDLKVIPFSIPHDAANPCGFNIFYNNTTIESYIRYIITDIASKLDLQINQHVLKDNDKLIAVMLEEKERVFITTKNGFGLSFLTSEIPVYWMISLMAVK